MRSKASEKDYTQERSDEVIAMHPAESGMQVGRALLHALHSTRSTMLEFRSSTRIVK